MSFIAIQITWIKMASVNFLNNSVSNSNTNSGTTGTCTTNSSSNSNNIQLLPIYIPISPPATTPIPPSSLALFKNVNTNATNNNHSTSNSNRFIYNTSLANSTTLFANGIASFTANNQSQVLNTSLVSYR